MHGVFAILLQHCVMLAKASPADLCATPTLPCRRLLLWHCLVSIPATGGAQTDACPACCDVSSIACCVLCTGH